MVYEIGSQNLRVRISTRGAEIVSVEHCGTERSWQNIDGSWQGHAPILFPVCGHCAVTVNGEDYGMPSHGFAKSAEFECVSADAACSEFVLRSNAKTRRVYPFDFELFVKYEVCGSRIVVTHTVKSTGDGDVYFSLGGHDSFVLERDVGEYKLVFPQCERFTALLHDNDGRLTGEMESFGAGRELRLPEAFLSDGQTLILSALNSESVRLCRADGAPCVELEFRGFGNLLLWHPHGTRMICIEPWLNLPDGVNDGNTEFCDKRGVVRVPRGGSVGFVRSISYISATLL